MLPTAAALLAVGLAGAACRTTPSIGADDAPTNARAHEPIAAKHEASPAPVATMTEKPAGNELAEVPVVAPMVKKAVLPAPKPQSTVRPPIQPRPDPLPMMGDMGAVQVTHPFGSARIA